MAVPWASVHFIVFRKANLNKFKDFRLSISNPQMIIQKPLKKILYQKVTRSKHLKKGQTPFFCVKAKRLIQITYSLKTKGDKNTPNLLSTEINLNPKSTYFTHLSATDKLYYTEINSRKFLKGKKILLQTNLSFANRVKHKATESIKGVPQTFITTIPTSNFLRKLILTKINRTGKPFQSRNRKNTYPVISDKKIKTSISFIYLFI